MADQVKTAVSADSKVTMSCSSKIPVCSLKKVELPTYRLMATVSNISCLLVNILAPVLSTTLVIYMVTGKVGNDDPSEFFLQEEHEIDKAMQKRIRNIGAFFMLRH